MTAPTFTYGDTTLILAEGEYSDGSTAVRVLDAVTGEPWATLSSRFPNDEALPKGAFRLKDWSENAGIAEAVIEAGLVTPVDIAPALSGFVWADAYRLVTK